MRANQTLTIGALILLLLLTAAEASFAADEPKPEPQWHDPFRYASHASGNPARSPRDKMPTPKVESSTGLSAIFVSNGVYQALYNGQLVNPGDRVGGLLFREITLYAVIVEDRAGRRRIELFNENQ
jgi:hypothetical protein